MTKPSANDWKARELAEWNSTTFRAYLADKHKERFGIPYITNSIPKEAACIKRMTTEFGHEIVKAFIDACLVDYTPSAIYPTLNFMFMYSYMRERVLPKVIAKKQADQTKDAEQEATETMDTDDAIEWL